VEVNYTPSEEITIGLIRYYQVEAEKQYKTLLDCNYLLTKTVLFRNVNPWPKRMQDF
jgi:hypothetical protein